MGINWIHYKQQQAIKDGQDILSDDYPLITEPQQLYRLQSYSYMKFFKMDLLCKWAWLGAEGLLLNDNQPLYEGIDKSKIAVVLTTSHGCLDVDKKYKASMSEIPSPALFVYTLPNIMLGEICIRHGFKGEQLCLANERFDAEELQFWVNDLLNNRGMEACLFGWADAWDDKKDICMFWATKDGRVSITTEQLDQLYNQ